MNRVNRSRKIKPPRKEVPRSIKSWNLISADLVIQILTYGLYLIRLVIIFIPQYGYIQPDEFHQFTEPMAMKWMNVHGLKVWEFEREKPLRSMVLPQILVAPFFWFFRRFFHQNNYQQLSSYSVLILPRFIMALFTFLIDYALNRITINHQPQGSFGSNNSKQQRSYLSLVHSSTYLAFTYYGRTFTNTIEAILMAILLLVTFNSCQQHQSKTSTWKSTAKIGCLLSMGFFNRPTFAIFACVPLIYWIFVFKSFKPSLSKELTPVAKRTFLNLLCNTFQILQAFTITSVLFIWMDTWYYGRLDFKIEKLQLPNLQSVYGWFVGIGDKSWIITPWNFIQYNIQAKNLANHGLHPFYFHWVVCFPLMFTLMALIAYHQWLQILWEFCFHKSDRWHFLMQNIADFYYSDSRKRLPLILHLTILVSLFGLSLIPHHEPRFLLPLIMPMVCLFGQRLLSRSKAIIALWFGTQILLTVFYGFVHQAGVVSSLIYLKQNHHEDLNPGLRSISPRSDNNLIFARMYLPPRHLLLLPENPRHLQIYDYSIEPLVPSLAQSFERIFDRDFERVLKESDRNTSSLDSHPVRTFLMLPSVYDRLWRKIFDKIFVKYSITSYKPNISIQLLKVNFPSFSGEDLDDCLQLALQGQEPQISKLDSNEDLKKRFNITIDHSNETTNYKYNDRGDWWSLMSRFKRAFAMSVWMIDLN